MSDKQTKIEFLCCKCGKIPEILKIHTDNSKIELNCKICGKYEISINEYFAKLEKNNNFKICSLCLNKKKNNEFFFCLNCKKDFCKACKNNSKHVCQNKKTNLIDINKKKNFCLDHNQEFKYYCFDCQENFCENKEHKDHETHNTTQISSYLEAIIGKKNRVKEINDELSKIVKFNELILDNIDLFQDNDYFKKSIKNIGKSLEEGNKRNSNDLKCLLNKLSIDIGISDKAIEKLINSKEKIQLSRKEKYLRLNNRNLDDQYFKDISQIRFNQLKEIDISENNIKDIQPFNKMSLPFLEFLNLSFNEIQAISPVAKLKSKELEYIFLQRNHINDIDSFLKSESDFQNIKILRVEDNDIIYETNSQNQEEKKKAKETKEKLDKISKKYSGKFVYKPLKEQIEDFIEKYKNKNLGISIFEDVKKKIKDEKNKTYMISETEDKINIKEKNAEDIKNIVANIIKIDLHDATGNNDILKYLFLIITYKNENKIKELILRNNFIKDASMLKRVNFKSLKKLDLAVNNIEDSNFLKDIRAKNLEQLYLDNNNLKGIYPILNAKFEKLKVLSLNQNDYDSDKMENSPGFKELIEELKSKNSDFIYQIEAQ